MSIEESALAHIMTVLTDLYSDPEMAVVREYSTNARDSHIEAGKADRPIEVTLPSPLAPYLRIRDYGMGLDADDIREIYSRYGASTKRDSDDVVGVLGLGCKSGLTYADQFTLSGIKGGLRYEVVVSREEDGTGSMTVLAPVPTDEEEGAEVVIPARQHNSFEEKAEEFFRFWDEGTVLVNGEQPKRIEGLWIADDLLLTTETSDAMTVVMGGVPYPVPDQWRYSGQHIVAWVGMGDVNFTPSRESLQMTAKTKAKVREIEEREKVEKREALLKLVAEAKSAPEAAQIAQRARNMGLKDEPLWNGQPVPAQLEGDFITADYPKRYKVKGFGKSRSIVNGANQAFVIGFPGAEFSPYKRRKLDQWAEKQNGRLGNPSLFVIVPRLPREIRQWIPKERIFKWAEIDAEKLPSTGKGGGKRQDGRPTGSYDLWTSGSMSMSRGVEADTIPTKNLFYYNGPTGWYASMPPEVKRLLGLVDGANVVVLAANRIAKFERDFPMARKVGERLAELRKEWRDGLKPNELLALRFHGPNIVENLNPDRIEDPKLRRLVKALKNRTRLVKEMNVHGAEVGRAADGDQAWENYPLLSSISHYYGKPHEHVYTYLNAVYHQERDLAGAAAEKEGD